MSSFIPFTHACSVCGSPNAGWGLKVRMRYSEPGVWYCYEHYPNKDAYPIKPHVRGEPILPQRRPVQQSLQF